VPSRPGAGFAAADLGISGHVSAEWRQGACRVFGALRGLTFTWCGCNFLIFVVLQLESEEIGQQTLNI